MVIKGLAEIFKAKRPRRCSTGKHRTHRDSTGPTCATR
jgi:hypothetical protein